MIEITTTACQFVIAMGSSVYCRTCAAPPGNADEAVIDIFANAKLIAILSTLKEWQLDIMQDDNLSQHICETCELALIQIDEFRLQALRAKEHLHLRLHSLETMVGDAEAINDNENDLHTKTNCGEAEMHNRQAAPNTFPTVSEFTAMYADDRVPNVTNANKKGSKEQLIEFESGLIAANEQTGELSFDSNIESSRPPEFQVVLIEEEEETNLQWISEEEDAGEKGIHVPNSEISECSVHVQEVEREIDTNNNSVGTAAGKSINFNRSTQRTNAKSVIEEGEKVCLNKNISFDLQKYVCRTTDYKIGKIEKSGLKGKPCKDAQRHGAQKVIPNNGKDNQFTWVITETSREIAAPMSDKKGIVADYQSEIHEFETLLAAINDQVAAFESGKESNAYLSDDLQSVLMNELTLQMINANVNILEEDLQIDEFETMLAAVDEQASTLGSINTPRQTAEIPDRQMVHKIGFNEEIDLDIPENQESILKEMEALKKEDFSPLYEKSSATDTVNFSNSTSEAKIKTYNSSCVESKITDYAHYQFSPNKIKRIISDDNISDVLCGVLNEPDYRKIYNGESLGKANTEFIKNNNSIQNAALGDKEIEHSTAVVSRPNKKSSNGMRCRLCVYKVSEQPIFATKELLAEHIASIHDDKERPYNCPQCAARYRTRSGCVAHINAIHLKKADSCELCGKVVAGGSGQMRMHIERNHTHGNYTCDVCQLELKNVSLYNFKYHKRWHNEDKLWRCELCGKAFVTRTHLMTHKVTHTRQGEFLCTRCGRSMRSKWELRTHLYAIHGEGEAPLKCNYCDEKFTQHIQKRAHLERCHPIELAKRTVRCPKCKKQFSTETNLQKHLKQQHQQDNADTTRKSEVVATSPQPYEGFMCAHCPRKYRSKYSLIKHLRVHVTKTDRPYSCRDCDMHFKHFSELDRHDLQHHATVRPYRCGKCSKAFSTRTALKIHGKVHEVKGRNFRCPECNQRFKFEKSLNLHLLSHKSMRHSCDICNKSYIRLAQLKTHINRYHKITSASEE
ncbi:uncharacterized protein LOC129245808 [Anastrepha obliqua]|uniref:uncharacterized protein LOC129245808 n=1 Tax=Anastrepha obliqua TaxID=95512 RepID=UPI00240A88E6|nr:uncharacterized protein LOC129245808 [Anastrepha obliqua]